MASNGNNLTALQKAEGGLEGKLSFKLYDDHMHPDHQETLETDLADAIEGEDPTRPGMHTVAIQKMYELAGDKKDIVKNKSHAKQILLKYAERFFQRVKPSVLKGLKKIKDEKARNKALLSQFDHYSGLRANNLSARIFIDQMANDPDKKGKKHIRQLSATLAKTYLPHLNKRYHNTCVPMEKHFEYADHVRKGLKKVGGEEEIEGILNAKEHHELRSIHDAVIKTQEPPIKMRGIKYASASA